MPVMKLLDNVSIVRKLAGAAAVALIVMGGTGLGCLVWSGRAFDDALRVVQAHDARITAAVRWKGMIETNAQRVLAITATSDPATAQLFGGAVKQAIAAIGELQQRIADEASTPAERAALELIAQRRAAVLADVKAAGEAKRNGVPVPSDVAQVSPALAGYFAALDDFVRLEEGQRDAARAAIDAAVTRLRWSAAVAAGAVFALMLGGMAWIARSISRPLAQAADAADAIAHGELRTEVTAHLATGRGDEIGRLMRSIDGMAGRLRSLVADVRDGAVSVSAASQ